MNTTQVHPHTSSQLGQLNAEGNQNTYLTLSSGESITYRLTLCLYSRSSDLNSSTGQKIFHFIQIRLSTEQERKHTDSLRGEGAVEEVGRRLQEVQAERAHDAVAL
jgi:hypothetical protein